MRQAHCHFFRDGEVYMYTPYLIGKPIKIIWTLNCNKLETFPWSPEKEAILLQTKNKAKLIRKIYVLIEKRFDNILVRFCNQFCLIFERKIVGPLLRRAAKNEMRHIEPSWKKIRWYTYIKNQKVSERIY